MAEPFPEIPSGFLAGSLAGQPFPPPTMVAQMDADKNAGEFWTALGNPPRPAFYAVVTVAMDIGADDVVGPPVVTSEVIVKSKKDTGPEPVLDDMFEIAGTVRDAASTAAIPGAQVTFVELGRTTLSGADGTFRFARLQRGNYTLRAAATGFTTQAKAIAVPGTVLDAYDMNLTT